MYTNTTNGVRLFDGSIVQLFNCLPVPDEMFGRVSLLYCQIIASPPIAIGGVQPGGNITVQLLDCSVAT